MKKEILEVIDQDAWTVQKKGVVYVSKGALIQDGPKQTHSYAVGDGFSVWPVDARVRHQADGSAKAVGPFTILQSQQPKASDPLQLGRQGATDVELSDEVRSRLEKLGYMQGD